MLSFIFARLLYVTRFLNVSMVSSEKELKVSQAFSLQARLLTILLKNIADIDSDTWIQKYR